MVVSILFIDPMTNPKFYNHFAQCSEDIMHFQNFEITKNDVSTFDIWKISQDDNTMYLLQRRGADCFVAHAVTVFDSNLKFAV
jgi:hypothetical protein